MDRNLASARPKNRIRNRVQERAAHQGAARDVFEFTLAIHGEDG